MALEARVPIVPCIVWGAHRVWTKDHPKRLGRNKIPFTVYYGDPLSPTGSVTELDSALKERMRSILRDVQLAYPRPQGRGGYRRAWAAAPRHWTMPEVSTRPNAPAGPGSVADAARSDRHRRRRHSAGRRERVTDRTRHVVQAAVASGTTFVLATGRPPRWIPPIVEALGFAPMAVCANGAVIYDPDQDRVISARTLPVDVLGELAEIATRVIPGVGLAVERWVAVRMTRPRPNSSVRPATSMPGSTPTTPRFRSRTC